MACFRANQKITLAPQTKKFAQKPCSSCGKMITRRPCDFDKDANNHFCNRVCYYEFNRATKAATRNKTKCYVCGDMFNLAAKYANTRKRPCCSRKCSGIMRSKIYRGPDHPRWNPNITDDEREINRAYVEYLDWRRDVFIKDAYTCVCCGDNSGGNLVAHHILNYSEYVDLRTDVSNGTTLCSVCHKGFHDRYGYRNNNGIQLEQYLTLYKTVLTV